VIPEDLDLVQVAHEIKAALLPGEPIGYLRGKSLMRNVLVQHSGFSELEAEELIDTMELRGILRFLGDPAEPSHAESRWRID
jgi:hypothetical protein